MSLLLGFKLNYNSTRAYQTIHKTCVLSTLNLLGHYWCINIKGE